MKTSPPRPTEIKEERLRMGNRPTKTIQEIQADIDLREKWDKEQLKPFWKE